MAEKKRIKKGIMGGTFDPIHIGHLILGENAYLQFGLDSVLFMPSGNPPHKRGRTGRASTQERVDMVRLALADNPHFELSLIETHDQGYTYTKETLLRLTKENPDTDYYFIMGADSLFSFDSWLEPGEICRLATLVVAVRNHIHAEELDRQILYLKEKYQVKFIFNAAYNIKNNIESLYLARNEMKNTYICSCDNYFMDNPFHQYEYQSFYAGVTVRDRTN